MESSNSSSRIGRNNVLTEEKKKYVFNMRKGVSDEDVADPVTGKINLKYFNVKRGMYWSKRQDQSLIRLILLYGPTAVHKIRNHTDVQTQPASIQKERQKKSQVVARSSSIFDLQNQNDDVEMQCNEDCAEQLDQNKDDQHLVNGGQPLVNWSETEVRLRICKLLGTTDLKKYQPDPSAQGHIVSFKTIDDIQRERARNKQLIKIEEMEKGKDKISVGGVYYDPPKEVLDGERPSMYQQLRMMNPPERKKQVTKQQY